MAMKGRRSVRAVAMALAVVLVVANGVAFAAEGPEFDLSVIDSDEEGVAELNSAIASGWRITKKKHHKNLLRDAMARGYWGLTEALITHAKAERVDMTHPIYTGASSIRKQLKALEQALRAKPSKVATGIPPAFQWAQSPDTVFLNVKFAHKLDTPATLGCEASNVSILPSEFEFKAECKTQRKVFKLNFKPLKEIDADASSWTMLSVGRAMFTLKKANNATWTRLLKDRSQKQGNMHVWWSMKEKYEKENEAFQKVEQEVAKRDFQEKQRKLREAKEAGSDTENGEVAQEEPAEAEPTNVEAAPAPAEEAEPELTPFLIHQGEVQKKYRKQRKSIEEALKNDIAEIDRQARTDKLEVVKAATLKKKSIAEKAGQDKAAKQAEADAKKLKLQEEEVAELSALEEQYSKSEL